MMIITISVCILMIAFISIYCELRVANALRQVFDAQLHSMNTHEDASAMYYVLLDIHDHDEDYVQEIVDNKKEELFS